MEQTEMGSLFAQYDKMSLKELEERLLASHSHEEKAFYRTLVNLKLQLSQEKIIGKALV